MLKDARAMSDMLSGDSYGTLGPVLPAIVKLDRQLQDVEKKFQKELDDVQHVPDDVRDDSIRASTCAISFTQHMRAQLLVRLDPYSLKEDVNGPYLVATFLHPVFHQFQFYYLPFRQQALKPALKYLHKYIEGLKRPEQPQLG